jgi:hypothetical protein
LRSCRLAPLLTKKKKDKQLLRNPKLRGDHVGFTEKTRNEVLVARMLRVFNCLRETNLGKIHGPVRLPISTN